MREWIARGIVLLTLAVVVSLGVAFAVRHEANRAGAAPSTVAAPSPSTVPAPPGPDLTEARRIFRAQGCTSCHSVAGEGSPRYPLDDVGLRRNAAELRAWITATGPAVDELPPAVQRRKEPYRHLPETELAALIDYLSAQRAKRE